MRLAVTRPLADSVLLKSALEARGHDVILCPLMEIRLCDTSLDLTGVQALIATSANGVRALARATSRRDLPLFAVGPATGDAARLAGFAQIEIAGGDSAALVKLVQVRLLPGAGRLLHAAGSVVAGDLKGDLEKAGFAVERQILYEARACGALPPALGDALRSQALDGILLFSPRTARLLAQYVNDAGLTGMLGGVAAFCLSPAVAEAARVLPFARIAVADTPHEAALVAQTVVSGAPMK